MSNSPLATAALWIRVSKTDQDPDQQLADLTAFAEQRGLSIVGVFRAEASAWKGHHHPALNVMQHEAMSGRFEYLIVWSLDRLTRRGPAAMLDTWRQLASSGVTLISYREPWLEQVALMGPALTELMLAFSGYLAQAESVMNSDRVKRALAQRRAKGLPLGRPHGSKDKRKRDKTGQQLRRARERLDRQTR